MKSFLRANAQEHESESWENSLMNISMAEKLSMKNAFYIL